MTAAQLIRFLEKAIKQGELKKNSTIWTKEGFSIEESAIEIYDDGRKIIL